MEKNQNLQPGRLLVIGLAVAELALLHGKTTEAGDNLYSEATACYQPTADDYAQLDGLLAPITDSDWGGPRTQFIPIQTVESYFSSTETDEAAKTMGVEAHPELFEEAMNDIIGEPETKHIEERLSQVKTQMFNKLLQLTADKYGMGIRFETDMQDLGGNTKSGDDKTFAAPATLNNMTGWDVLELSRTVSSIPAEFFRMTGEKSLVMYNAIGAKNGRMVTGYVQGTKEIHLDVHHPGALRHELGHEVDGTQCRDIQKDPVIAKFNNHGDIYGDNPAQPPSLETLRAIYDEELQQARRMDNDSWGDNLTLSEGLCVVDQAHPESKDVATVSGYHTTVAEDKAEIFGRIFDNSGELNSLVDPCKPILSSKARLVLARTLHQQPAAVEYLIRQTYGSSYQLPLRGHYMDGGVRTARNF